VCDAEGVPLDARPDPEMLIICLGDLTDANSTPSMLGLLYLPVVTSVINGNHSDQVSGSVRSQYCDMQPTAN
jgi:hypothetical protein